MSFISVIHQHSLLLSNSVELLLEREPFFPDLLASAHTTHIDGGYGEEFVLGLVRTKYRSHLEEFPL